MTDAPEIQSCTFDFSCRYRVRADTADGLRQVRRLTKNGGDNLEPAWFDPTFAVEVAPFATAPAGEKLTIWGWLKRVDR